MEMAEQNLLLAFINHHRNDKSEVFKLRVAPPRARVEGGEEVTAWGEREKSSVVYSKNARLIISVANSLQQGL